MTESFLDRNIEFLKGVGPQRAQLLNQEIGVKSFGDLLRHFPFRYVDRSKFYKLNECRGLGEGDYQTVVKILDIKEIGGSKQKRLVVRVSDSSDLADLIWFRGLNWVKSGLKVGSNYLVFGKMNFFNGTINFVHPEIEILAPNREASNRGLQPIYRTTEKLSNRGLGSLGLLRLVKEILEHKEFNIKECFPDNWISSYAWPIKAIAFYQIHFPSSEFEQKKARERLVFEEFFFLELHILLNKKERQQQYKGFVFDKVGKAFNSFYKSSLPFDLTAAQKKVIKEIRADLGSGKQMNRLLQGDVGSGKTIVALMCMLLAIDNGFQACLMAPTEILANQHFKSLSELLGQLPYPIQILSGNTKKSARAKMFQDLKDGELPLIVGTHALLEDKVEFNNLGLAVIDEQHRFGVEQRAKLWRKNRQPPHILVMTATPIPRTLAMTVHGDLDLSVIDELPPGRKPIETWHRYENRRLEVFGLMKNQITLGRQVYVVYPLIEESEVNDYKNLMEGFGHLQVIFPRPVYEIAIVHGKMKPEEKEFEMNRFVNGSCQILVATTVIEVGVNVPNATVMVVESAERFGLSQLHQLRGRVGRGLDKSYCVLVTGHKLSKDALKRMEVMVETNDGFKISEMDLQIRGPGDLLGTQQSGTFNLKLASLLYDGNLLTEAKSKAEEVLLGKRNSFDFSEMRSEYVRIYGRKSGWSRIS